MGERLQKVLARAGIGSRRASEELIASGRVTVNGEVAELGRRVELDDEIVVDGMRIQANEDIVYLAFNKPLRVLSAMEDDRGRATIGDYVGEYDARGIRLFHVGRLDYDTEGLILLTNDGALAHKLAHPSFGVPKTYLAEVDGPVKGSVGQQLRAGVELDDGPAAVDSFRVVSRHGSRVLVELVLHEGRNRIVRRMLAAVGHPVRSLVRRRFGPIDLGGLRSGALRELSRQEVGALFAAVDEAAQ